MFFHSDVPPLWHYLTQMFFFSDVLILGRSATQMFFYSDDLLLGHSFTRGELSFRVWVLVEIGCMVLFTFFKFFLRCDVLFSVSLRIRFVSGDLRLLSSQKFLMIFTHGVC